METEDVGAWVERAVEAARTATGADEYEVVRELLGKAAAEGAVALGIGVAMLGSGEAVVRATGCDLLGLVCDLDDLYWEEAATALLACAASESEATAGSGSRSGSGSGSGSRSGAAGGAKSGAVLRLVSEPAVDVRWHLAGALGSTRDARAEPLLVGWADDADSDLRQQVAGELSWVATGDPNGPGVRALMRLTRDAEPEVRNWATFALGSMLEVDTAEIRVTLWDRVGDDFAEAHAEGVRGLARRHDPRAVDLLAALLDAEDGADPLNFQAAQILGDPALVPHLTRHDAQSPDVAAALAECDPATRAHRDACAATLLEAVHQELPDARATLSGHRFDPGLILELTIEGEPQTWFVEPLLTRAGGDPHKAAALVLTDTR
ncbi:HEAT repeat domain-containing protein [Streptomyces sp. SID3343]|uniref:HEAT repeat domain-containing protein n=1 Tax=Streptomyces sp. SID3343 TaxID=2690260 RepID=UPI001367AE98|nr:HEAT repeat domain-containing protein [Streptomyces sp. SID3343]MYV97386.1 hypothetical protein [Streptomyces sp. SID3343]